MDLIKTLNPQRLSNFFEVFIEKSDTPSLILSRNEIIKCNTAARNFFKIKEPISTVNFSVLFKAKFSQNNEERIVLEDEIISCIKNENHNFDISTINEKGKVSYFQIHLTSISKFNGQEIVYVIVNELSGTKKLKRKYDIRLKAVDKSSNSIIITDEKGTIEYVNKAVLKNTGYERNEIIGQNPRIFKANSNNVVDYKNLWDTIASGKIWRGKFLNKTKTGKLFWEQATITPIVNEHNTIENFIGIKENISALKESEELLLNIINSSPNIVYYIDSDLSILKVNSKFEQVFDVKREDVVGKENALLKSKIKNQEFWNILISLTNQVVKEKKTLVTEVKITLGNNWFEIIKVPIIEDTEVIGVVTIIKDITDRKHRENELFSISTLLDETGKMAKIGGWKLNVKESELNWTNETYRIHGLEVGSKIDVNNALNYYQNESKHNLSASLKGLMENGESYELELEFKDANGIEKWVKTIGIPYFEKDELVSIFGTIQDITDKKQKDFELIRAKQNAEKSNQLKTEFLQNLSHEIRTPMNAILGFSDLVDTTNLDDKSINYLSIVKNSGLNLLSVIDDILEISFLETKQVKIKLEEFNLYDFIIEIHTIFNLQLQKKSINFSIDKGLIDNSFYIISDKIKLFKVLNNLIKNAIKYTIEGSITIGYKIHNDKLQFFVKDTGIGISQENYKTIFERFSRIQSNYTEHTRGIGLGLSIAKENVELLGGTLEVESELGVGSTFYFDITCELINKNQFTIDESVNDSLKKTVLIVENDLVNFLYLEILLERFDSSIAIVHADNGSKAVDLCNETSFDLILMDIQMPVMDGFEATALIKNKFPKIPIIAQTAFTSDWDVKKIVDAGFTGYIAKPINESLFIQKINKHLKITKH